MNTIVGGLTPIPLFVLIFSLPVLAIIALAWIIAAIPAVHRWLSAILLSEMATVRARCSPDIFHCLRLRA